MRGPSGHLKTDLDVDAWGRQKAIIDLNKAGGLFTFNIPVSVWYETFNGTERAFTSFTSEDGAMIAEAGGTLNDDSYLRTFKNPRYEPNRGALYSTAAIIDNPNAAMVRRFGQFTDEAGVFFELDNGTFYGVVRTTIGGVTSDDRFLIRTNIQGNEFDLSKGNVYDIQWQWRGVGNYVFFVNLQEVASSAYLGTLTNLSMFNPAIPIAFQSINQGDNAAMIFGCVDVSSEGGSGENLTYGSVCVENESGSIALPADYNTPVIAIRSKLTVSGFINTRDSLALLLSAYADQKAFVRVWATRDFTAIADGSQSWTDYGDGHLEYVIYDPAETTPISLDTTKAQVIFGCRVGIDNTYSTSALFEGRTDIWQHPGDMFVFTLHRENGLALNGGVSYEFAEEI